jgi:glycosyltransferase involved in cell wall biosynthesis
LVARARRRRARLDDAARARNGRPLRICLVYDCLFPYTIGGAERWYRSLAEELAARGYRVTYLTLRQWEAVAAPAIPGVAVTPVGPRLRLYGATGRRLIAPPLVFGAGVAWHLARNGSSYDVVHTSAFPYFSVLAAAAARRWRRFGLVVDWLEVWPRQYWQEYLGPLKGDVGWRLQRACIRLEHRPLCLSKLTAERLAEEGIGAPATLISPVYDVPRAQVETRECVAVFAGRHVREKRVPAVVAAIAHARETIPELRGLVLGEGPQTRLVRRAIEEYGLHGVIQAPGWVPPEDVHESFARAMCVVSASAREGFGLIVVEAAAVGTPSVLARAADNAATELIEPGVNGVIADSADPEALGEAIVAVWCAGSSMRASTVAWYTRNAERHSVSRTLRVIASLYEESARRARPPRGAPAVGRRAWP